MCEHLAAGRVWIATGGVLNDAPCAGQGFGVIYEDDGWRDYDGVELKGESHTYCR